MKLFTGYIVCKAECYLCSHKWTGVVEVDCIEIDGVTEYKKPKELECSNCSAMTDNYMVIEETKTDVSSALPHPIKFGRWLLKYAKEGWDKGLLCWQYDGEFYNTDELYEIFCLQQ